MTDLEFFVTAPHGTEDLLMAEIDALGAKRISSIRSGAAFFGSLATAYRICLWSRVASRVFLPLVRFQATSADQLYAGARDFAWENHMSPSDTFAVDCSLHRSQISHSRFAALRVKDGVVDRFRDRCGQRPSVEVNLPGIRIFALVDGEAVTLCLDLSGEGLYRRGYRTQGGQAPLKENLAAAILLRAGWPAAAREGQALLDPLCGSGTLLIEGALMAADVAPGIFREHFGFLNWAGHDAAAWRNLLDEASQRRSAGQAGLPLILGCDRDPSVVAAAVANAAGAGLTGKLRIEQAEFASWLPSVRGECGERGLILTNPPYGERLDDATRLAAVYASLGDCCRRHYAGWRLSVISGNPELAGIWGYEPTRTHSLRNGPIRARNCFTTSCTPRVRRCGRGNTGHRINAESAGAARCGRRDVCQPAAQKFQGCAALGRSSEGVRCYRVYDADLPEYAVAIDLYQGRVHVQEYQAAGHFGDSRLRPGRGLQDVLRVVPVRLSKPGSPTKFFSSSAAGSGELTQYGRNSTKWAVF
jgi:23S rRNA (guanine2445-N2)-methyltransferase / 23S rRNA (guanine2069-N7)-methyltransferase